MSAAVEKLNRLVSLRREGYRRCVDPDRSQDPQTSPRAKAIVIGGEVIGSDGDGLYEDGSASASSMLTLMTSAEASGVMVHSSTLPASVRSARPTSKLATNA